MWRVGVGRRVDGRVDRWVVGRADIGVWIEGGYRRVDRWAGRRVDTRVDTRMDRYLCNPHRRGQRVGCDVETGTAEEVVGRMQGRLRGCLYLWSGKVGADKGLGAGFGKEHLRRWRMGSRGHSIKAHCSASGPTSTVQPRRYTHSARPAAKRLSGETWGSDGGKNGRRPACVCV